MRNFTILLITFFFANIAVAQENGSRNGIIGLAIGPSIPSGDFADTGSDNEDAGFATTGIHLNFNFGYLFSENVGIAALWSGSAHNIDADEMLESFQMLDPSLSWTLNSTSWSNGNLLGGLLISFPSGNSQFDIRGLVGFASNTSPQLDMTATDGSDFITITQHDSDATSFAVDIGAGVRIALSEKIAFTFNVDYYSTKPSFEMIVTSSAGSNTGEYEQQINMLNIGAGIGFRLK